MIPVILLINIFLLHGPTFCFLLWYLGFFWWGLHCAVVHQIKSTAAIWCQMPNFMTLYWLSDYFHYRIIASYVVILHTFSILRPGGNIVSNLKDGWIIPKGRFTLSSVFDADKTVQLLPKQKINFLDHDNVTVLFPTSNLLEDGTEEIQVIPYTGRVFFSGSK